MKIGLDIRLKDQTGVGRYIRNLMHYLPLLDKKNEYVFIEAPYRWHSFLEQLQLSKYISTYHVDLMHFPYFSAPFFYSSPFVITIHDLIINSYKTGHASTKPYLIYKSKLYAYEALLKKLTRSARAVIVPSKTAENLLHMNYPCTKQTSQVIYQGFELEKHDHISSMFKPKRKFYLYVGNAYPHKNLKSLILGFDLLMKNEAPDIDLRIVGKNDYFMSKLMEYAQTLRCSKHLIFEFDIGDDRLEMLYKSALGLVIPSFNEGFGLPVLEAISLSCPVLVSEIPVFKELYKDIPLYFNPNSLKSIANCLRNRVAINQFSMDKRLQKGFMFSKQFTWRKTVEQTIQVYENCLSLRSGE